MIQHLGNWRVQTELGPKRAKFHPPWWASQRGDGLVVVVTNAWGGWTGIEPEQPVARQICEDICRGVAVDEALQLGMHLGFGWPSCAEWPDAEWSCSVLVAEFEATQTRICWSGGVSATDGRGRFTEPHLLIRKMMDAGHVTPHEMATHPHRHVVMHSLGGPVDRVVWPVGPVVIGTKWLQSWNASSQLWNGELDTLANVVAEQDASTLDGLFALRVVRVSSDDATMDDVGVEQ